MRIQTIWLVVCSKMGLQIFILKEIDCDDFNLDVTSKGVKKERNNFCMILYSKCIITMNCGFPIGHIIECAGKGYIKLFKVKHC